LLAEADIHSAQVVGFSEPAVRRVSPLAVGSRCISILQTLSRSSLVPRAALAAAIALALARAGQHDVVINYAGNETAARECAALCTEAAANEVRIEIVQADVSQAADRARMIDFVQSKFGRLDLLVNNAGITSIGRVDLLDAGEDSFDRVLGINLRGPYFLTQTAAKLMIASSPIANAVRAIINVTSISAFTVSVNRGDYCLAKAALAMMTQLYAVRLSEFGIGVFEIQPGIIATDAARTGAREIHAPSRGLAPINRWGQPEVSRRRCSQLRTGIFRIHRSGLPRRWRIPSPNTLAQFCLVSRRI
jgi:NAD(P)-dependent dehydrogenase (short-subunit alcohol dehydrogenase family)